MKTKGVFWKLGENSFTSVRSIMNVIIPVLCGLPLSVAVMVRVSCIEVYKVNNNNVYMQYEYKITS